jgi:hypothetical protein
VILSVIYHRQDPLGLNDLGALVDLFMEKKTPFSIKKYQEMKAYGA